MMVILYLKYNIKNQHHSFLKVITDYIYNDLLDQFSHHTQFRINHYKLM